MTKDKRDQARQDWGITHYGCVSTALSNLVSDWHKIAVATPVPGEEWVRDMAVQQEAKYSQALVEFERLF